MDGYEIIYECLNRQYANGNLTYDDISLYNEMAYDDFMIFSATNIPLLP